MWQIPLLLSIFCLSTVTYGQSQPKPRPPEITNFLQHDLLEPEQVKFRIPNALRLPCAATGSNLKWTWAFNGTDIPPEKYQFDNQWSLGGDGTLTAGGLGISDSGTYQCFVEDTSTGVSTFSRKLKVAVTAVGEFLDQSPRDVQVNLGETRTFNCPAHQPSFGVSFTWSGDDQIQFQRNERRAIGPNGDLHFLFVTQQDIDDINDLKGIRCTMSAANTFYSSGPLTLTSTSTDQPDPETPRAPAWSERPDATEIAVEGRNKTLYCLATGRPAPKITWRKNGQIIDVLVQRSFEIPQAFQGRLLNINKVQKSMHEDLYSCEARNSLDQLSFDINLKVQVAPKWNDAPPPRKLPIDINGNGTLSCNVYADPEPVKFEWYRDGSEIQQSSARVQLDHSKLQFKEVTLGEAGVYQCVAENVHGMIVSSTWVEVLAIKPSFAKRGFGPFYLFQDSEGRLKCDPEAAPRPNIFRWSKNDGQPISNGGPYRIEADGTLVISDVIRDRDQATYTCYAQNFLGNDEASARASVLDRTTIIRKPEDLKVSEGDRVDLRCEATFDPSLELHYMWMRDNAVIKYNQKFQWLRDQNVLTIADITVEDAGVYTCIAYTPEPKKSEDRASATIDIAGAPYPPTNLVLSSDCSSRNTTLSWVTGESNNASITNFLIERKSEYADDFWQVIANVTDANATSYPLTRLPGFATLSFRMRAVNRFGPSRPSEETMSSCRTDKAVPDKWPDNFRGIPGKAEQLEIAWTAMRKVEWNGPGLYYRLWYGRVDTDSLEETRIDVPTTERFNISDAGYYVRWQFQIQAVNEVGPGPKSPLVRQFSGQNPPPESPKDVTVGAVTARTVQLSWTPVTVSEGSVDGYRIYYWGESRATAKRRRRAVPGYASSTNVTGGDTQRHIVTNLKPYTDYTMAITAFNSGGEGPESIEVFAATEEAEPGPPSEVKVYAFAKYILVTWEPPVEPNGIITDYRVGSQTYSGSQPNDVEVEMEPTGAGARRKLLEQRDPEKYYVIEIQASTSRGWGTSVRKTTKTVKWAAPAKPEKPTVEGTAVDQVRVDYNFGLGGGYTHEFLVMYRKKLEGEEFQNTSWVNHFQQQSLLIGNLSPDLYEFKTVARNDFPNEENREESPASDVTEARPLPGVVNAGKRATTPIHETAWFIALLVLIAVLLIVLLIFVLYTRYQGAKYPVGKREKKRAALIDREPYDEEVGAFSNDGRTENPPPYPSQGSLPRDAESDRDSLDDYGEGPHFNEDGSFIEEYGDEKKVPPEEKDPSALATFV